MTSLILVALAFGLNLSTREATPVQERPPLFISALASTRDTLWHQGQTRIYWVHIPPAYAKTDTSLPLVVALHGGGGSGQQFEAQSKLSEKADKEGFIVVYPDGLQNPGVLKLRTWNAGNCCGQIASVKQTDDVGFIRKLIDKLTTTYRIDPKRVYATGHSNGAMLCYRLACEFPDKLAAIAANAGTMQLKTTCQPSRVLSILHIHSRQDNNVPYTGGIGSRSLNKQWNAPVDSTLAVFAKLAGCTPEKPTTKTAGLYTSYTWTGCRDDVAIQYYLTTDGGHAWPGGQKGARFIGDAPSEAFSNNDVIWDFFKSRSLP
ncbi:extracellular catalytic domain type 1 short-chain-length polyhydroxyalkanoate depolymerase [Spirosoma linguale]|uniref:Phospholipase/Carboxylesterase n=1 Tax=Spirosoma linguale (strain ATCC 33905 / DSM 74 / LMG 10896 / Claus 1) TaxID=504472 RepID=D2QNT7_SPILD|nr:phospholipase/Carboxylesterase [Spirosoma linguale DSM 74]